MMMMALFSDSAEAVVYLGNRYGAYPCAYMAPDDPETHWDGNDPEPYDTGDYLVGVNEAFSLVTWECTESWATMSFGPDEHPGNGWERKMFVHSSGPGFEDDAVCAIYYDGDLAFTYEVHLRY